MRRTIPPSPIGPETGEEPFASMLAVPVRRSGRSLGVLVVQNRTPRHFTDPEVDDLETVAMLLAEMLSGSGATDGSPEGRWRHGARACSPAPR